MKTLFRFGALMCAFVSSFILLPSALPQGSLTPPGAPAPTMKTLDQVEPRKEVNATNTPGDGVSVFKITAPGSYYLSANVTGVAGKHGIIINADNVTLDLNGFALTGVAGSFAGIFISSTFNNIVIRNGTVANWGDRGIRGDFARNSHFHQLQVRANGFHGLEAGTAARVTECGAFGNTLDGIRANDGSVISHCTASQNTGDGIEITAISGGVTLIGCTASNNTNNGIFVSTNCTVTDCTANANGGAGILAGDRNTLSHCTANGNSNSGILANFGSTLSQCAASVNANEGISVSTGSTLTNCTASNNQGTAGILAVGGGSSLTTCTALSNTGDGINAQSGSTLTNCTAKDNQGTHGIFAGDGSTLIHCTARSNTSAATASYGIYTDGRSSIIGCTASANTNTNGTATTLTGVGISSLNASAIKDCTVAENKGDGIRVAGDCLVVGNACRNNGAAPGDGAGVHVVTAGDNRIEGNNVADNTRGIDVDVAGNLIIKNSASGGTTPYDIVASNFVGTIVATEAAMNAAANSNINISY